MKRLILFLAVSIILLPMYLQAQTAECGKELVTINTRCWCCPGGLPWTCYEKAVQMTSGSCTDSQDPLRACWVSDWYIGEACEGVCDWWEYGFSQKKYAAEGYCPEVDNECDPMEIMADPLAPDYADVLSAPTLEKLDEKIKKYIDTTGELPKSAKHESLTAEKKPDN